jgi:hypothetical protein
VEVDGLATELDEARAADRLARELTANPAERTLLQERTAS